MILPWLCKQKVVKSMRGSAPSMVAYDTNMFSHDLTQSISQSSLLCNDWRDIADCGWIWSSLEAVVSISESLSETTLRKLRKTLIWFGLRLYVPSNNFSVMSGRNVKH